MTEKVEIKISLDKEVADKLAILLKEEEMTLEEALTKLVYEI